MRINRAEDDAASFAIGSQLGARLGGLTQALQNVSDAKSMLDVAEASAGQIIDRLINIKQDVTQGANAVPGTVEREFIRDSINGYAEDINRIIEEAEYNGIPLLDGTYDASFQVGESTKSSLNLNLDRNLEAQDLQVFEVSTEGNLTTDGTATESDTINVFEEWKNIQAKDTFDIAITRSDGSEVDPITIEAAGDKGDLTTTTIADVVAAINAQGEFEAEFDEDDQAIKIREISPDEGNNLAVSIENYDQFPGTDGASAEVNFEFDEDSGRLITNFTGVSNIDSNTLLNDLDQFDQLEGQDEIRVELTARDGETTEVVKVIDDDSATPASTTVGDLFDAFADQTGDKFEVELTSDGQIAVTEKDLEQFELDAETDFTEYDLNTGPSSVDDVEFAPQTTEVSYQDSGGDIDASDTLAGSDLGDHFRTGDSFRIEIDRSDGSTESFRYEFGDSDDTFGDLADAINSEDNLEASIVDGELIVRENTLEGGSSLGVRFNDLQESDVSFENPDTETTFLDAAISDNTDPVDEQTELRDSFPGDEFRQGDEFDITVQRDDGSTVTYTYSFESSEDTFEDLIDFINNDTSLEAELIDGFLGIRDPGETDGSYSVDLHNFSEAEVFGDPEFQEDGDDLVLTNNGDPMTPLTEIDDSVMGEGFRDGDTFELELTTSDGNTTETAEFTYSDGLTFGDIANEVNTQTSEFSAQVIDDQMEISDESGTTGDQFTAEFQNFEKDTQSAFTPADLQPATEELIIDNDGAGLTESTSLDGSELGENFAEGDTVDITLTSNDGTSETITYTFSGDDTFGDLADFIEQETDFETEFSGDELLISPEELEPGDQLGIEFSGFERQSAELNPADLTVTSRKATSVDQLTGISDTDTLLDDLDEFTNVQGGDELEITVEDGAGNTESFIFEFEGDASGPSTSTVGDLIDAIDSETSLEADFDSDLNAITLFDADNPDGSPSLSFSDDDFEAKPREPISETDDPPLSFDFEDEAMVSNELTVNGSPATADTRINDLDSFDDIQGNDELDITLTTRDGETETHTFVFDDVDPGENSDMEIQDLVDFIGEQTVGEVEFEAEFTDGRIHIEETNPPQTGDFDSDTDFEEYDISIEPSEFSEFDLNISDFLEIDDDTGLVVGLGFVDLDADTELSQSVSQLLLRNIDDAIERVTAVINDIGTFQAQLSRREEDLQSTINANEAARSRIMDVDFAREKSSLLQQQILYQNQISFLSQANLAPQSLLDLL